MKVFFKSTLFVLSFFFISYVEGALLVAPVDQDFTKEERVTIYRVLKEYSLPSMTKLREDPSEFVAYDGTERDFVEHKIRVELPNAQFTIHDVPATLHDVWFIQEYFREEKVRRQVDSMHFLSEAEGRELEREEIEVDLYFQASRAILAKWVRGKEVSLLRDWLGQALKCSDAFPERPVSFKRLRYEHEKLERDEKSFLREALRMEIQAIEKDRVVFFRGSRGFKIWDMHLLDFPFESEYFSYDAFLERPGLSIRTHEFSFSSSLLSGFLRDSYNRGKGACTYALIYNEEDKPDEEKIIYAISLDKRWLVRHGVELFYLPKMILGGVWREGELFHPRLRSILGCSAERMYPSIAQHPTHSGIAAHHYTPPLGYDFDSRREELYRNKERYESNACKVYLTELLREYIEATRNLEKVKGTWKYKLAEQHLKGLEKFLDPKTNFPRLDADIGGSLSIQDIMGRIEEESTVYLRQHQTALFESFVEETGYVALDKISPSQLRALSYGFEVAHLLGYNTEIMSIDDKGSQAGAVIIKNQRAALERLWHIFMPSEPLSPLAEGIEDIKVSTGVAAATSSSSHS